MLTQIKLDGNIGLLRYEIPEQKTMPYTSEVDTAKTIRKELKSSFPGIKFWVTSKSSINVSWIDGPTQEAVDAVVIPFKKVSYCASSGEVLSGGNTYVFTNRLFSESALNHAQALLN